ncbi:MAG: short-chain dehydrogenase [Draconibacterium sp.]|nr:MAG: short-chain dehydrogenase [Draconibacterium sp.]PIF06465.1 MAG: short-chain dehydrogenase [Draconibacterium sp.]
MKNRETALITGASGGLGKDFAQIFAQKGYNLVLIARSEEKLNNIARELEGKYKIKTTIFIQDLSEPNSASKIYTEVKNRSIHIDVLINNAGFGKIVAFVDEKLSTYTEMLNLNITTLTELTVLFLPEMIARNNGKILNVASTAAFQSLPNFGVYAATKAYVLNFTEALHYELKNTNIAVTALCPGPTLTGFAKRANAETSSLFKNAMDSKTVAQIGYKALMNNKMTVIAGFTNKFMAYLSRLIPSRRLLINIVGKMY